MKIKNVTIIGCGRMGNAVLSAVNSLEGMNVYGVEKDSEKRDILRKESGYEIYARLNEAPDSEIYIIAVKPQEIETVLTELKEKVDENMCVVSVAAGVTVDYIKEVIGKEVAVVRVMPNTPALAGKGMTAVFVSGKSEYAEDVKRIFGSVGAVVEVEEELMDTVTAVSGSGPAYFFLLAEVMEKFALDNGMDAESARKIAYETIIGAGELMKKSSKSFKKLREDVTSPGGTTQAAVEYMKEKGLENIFYNALEQAKKRSRELSGK